jgi:hypothetical protein
MVCSNSHNEYRLVSKHKHRHIKFRCQVITQKKEYNKCIHDKGQATGSEVFQSHVCCLLKTISVALLQHSGMDYEHVFRKLLERKGKLGYQVNNNGESKDFII